MTLHRKESILLLAFLLAVAVSGCVDSHTHKHECDRHCSERRTLAYCDWLEEYEDSLKVQIARLQSDSARCVERWGGRVSCGWTYIATQGNWTATTGSKSVADFYRSRGDAIDSVWHCDTTRKGE